MSKIAVIGAGISGVVCARKLRLKGHQISLFDKSRGVSGRSTTKRWKNNDVGIDMGVPFIKKNEITAKVLPLVNELKDHGIIQEWRINKNIETYVGVPKMSSIARFLANKIDINAQQKIINIKKGNNGWVLNSESDQFDGFDLIILAIPAPQIKLIHGLPDDILTKANSVSFNAVNSLLLQTNKKLWTDNDEIKVLDNQIIDIAIADYKKPKRDNTQLTYAIHSNKKWATQTFDYLSKEDAEEEMINALVTYFNFDSSNIVEKLLHRWKYSQIVQPNRPTKGFIASKIDPSIFSCGDWCNGGSYMQAVESGIEVAESIS